MRFEKSQLSPERLGSGSRWQVNIVERQRAEWEEVGRRGCPEKEPREAFKSEFNDRMKQVQRSECSETLCYDNLTSVRTGVLNVPGATEGSDGASAGAAAVQPGISLSPPQPWRCRQRHTADRPQPKTARRTLEVAQLCHHEVHTN